MLFLFKLNKIKHNNNGGFMKKIIVLIIFLTNINNIYAQNLYVSKRDIDTQDYVQDCDFLLYDENNTIVDAWIQNDDTHVINNIEVGKYKLVERPKIDNTFSNELSVFHDIDITDNSLEVVLYNNKIETPRNLGVNINEFTTGCAIIFLGIALIYIGYRKKIYT